MPKASRYPILSTGIFHSVLICIQHPKVVQRFGHIREIWILPGELAVNLESLIVVP